LPNVLLWHSTKKPLPSVFLALGKETSLPNVFYLTLGKAFFAEYRGFAKCFLFDSRQNLFCRAPEKKRSEKPPALGNYCIRIHWNTPMTTYWEVHQESDDLVHLHGSRWAAH
jgi:hypothetical protein